MEVEWTHEISLLLQSQSAPDFAPLTWGVSWGWWVEFVCTHALIPVTFCVTYQHHVVVAPKSHMANMKTGSCDEEGIGFNIFQRPGKGEGAPPPLLLACATRWRTNASWM